MQGWYYVESLTGQGHDRVQTENQELQPWAAVSILSVGSHQHGAVSSNDVISWATDHPYPLMMLMTSEKTEIQIFADWPMSHAI